MADGTKAVVDTSAVGAAADEAALAAAIDELAGSEDAGEDASADAREGAAAAAAVPGRTTADAEAAGAPERTPDDPADEGQEPAVGEETSEMTAPLSVQELRAELAAGSPRKKPAPEPTRPARRPTDPQPTIDPRDTATLPRTLPAPQRRSGDMIGHRYRLEECISQTETFSSWRAVDEKLRRAVGVHLMASGHQRARKVLAAAKSAALLGDPRFVQVLDAVHEGELVYVVREWLPHSSDLARLIANGPMEPHEAYQMVRQVADAVAAAHRRGQAHLRLTPRCVLRTDSGQYRINGIAVDAALRGLPAEGAEDAQRADTRAIGALLFAALTHRWPYPEDRYDLQGLPKGLQNVAPDQVRAGVHKGLSELAARTLFDQPPHHAQPITTPEELVRAIAKLPRIRQPEPELPVFPAPPRHNTHALPTAPNPTRVADATVSPLPASSRPTSSRRFRRRLRQVVKATAWTVALGAIGVASWQFVDHLRHTTGSSVTSSLPSATSASPSPQASTHNPVPLTVKSVQSYTGPGEGNEGSDNPAKTIDNDPNTVWTTQWYADQFGPKAPALKAGTGLLLDLGSPQAVSSVSVQFVGEHTAELRVPNASIAANPAQAKVDGFTVLGKKSGPNVDYVLDSPVTTRYLLLWLTALPKDGNGHFTGQVAEVKVSG
ncbi:protein kinase family protein [Kitasatospora sp. NPDC056783]|uniref:protein kinase family protein n=1 Tax=Kitasatospora sp. NPDC056783 TaxID=3345943 RepID=UPI0036BD88DC